LNSSKTAANAANQPGRTAGLSAAGGLGANEDERQKKEKTRRETTAIKGVGDAGRESCDHRQGRVFVPE
jgi:hypothetical protein